MDNPETTPLIRLDQEVARLLPKPSRAFASKLVKQGKVLINGIVNTKPGYKLHSSDMVTLDYDITELDRIPDIDLPVLYEDDDCVVINKPVGLLSHSKGNFNIEATVATWLRSRFNNPENERSGIVHRLDRATSGVMICAKNSNAASWLQKQFSQRKVKKSYVALVVGTPSPLEAVIDMPIERNPKAPATFRVGATGKSALTHYKVTRATGRYSLLELKPQTGRTHQLRVHLSHIGYPIVGDTFYSGEPADRLYLHAQTLEITLPNHSRQTFTAKIPASFNSKLLST
jgi:23S rRNA pseudouridine1911/1915/1917 synthase